MKENSGNSITIPSAGSLGSSDGRAGRWSRDLRRVALLGVLSVALGGITNFFRNPSLSWSYQSREERLATGVRALGGEPSGGTSKPAAGGFTRVSLPVLRTALRQRQPPLLIDARLPLFFKMGHLPGALHLPREGFQAALRRHRTVLEQDKNRQIVIYCQGGSCEDSDMVAEALRSLGFTRLSVFAGGWKEWQAAGLPAETGL
ncbi:MAG: Rhodanese-like domain protein [Verrucomicrobiales bacterium]|nr:Rhodanese-like domain protein [Verrucomicrobiales bacterium]